VEPVQGSGEMIPAPAGFLGGLRSLCDRHGMLLVVDEIMSGFTAPVTCSRSSARTMCGRTSS
jgi:glutamate-1-semialdehyde aminotransferase